MRKLPESWKKKQKSLQQRNRGARLRGREARLAGQLSTRSTLTWQQLKAIANEGPVAFCKKALNFDPTDYQIEFLSREEEKAQFVALVWCRQSGKSFIVAAFLLWEAVKHDGWQTAIIGPAFRQSKLVIRKINSFLQKLTKDILVGRKSLRTRIALINGSIIEAYPCNPDTIRGPTLNRIFADEFNFVREDEELYDAILFTLGTTNGGFIATSTPWSRDHIFYKMCNDSAYSDFKRIHVNWQRALEPNGPLKKNILEKIRRQFEADPWRWQREMEAQWAEDELSYFSQKLITQCIDSELAPLTDDWTKKLNAPLGRYFIGVDFGKKVDYSVVAVVRWDTKEKYAELKGMVRFPLETSYASVIGMVKVICDKLQRVEKVLVDQTGVGEFITEEMKKANIRSRTEGIMLTVASKQEVLGYMKNLMTQQALALYYDRDLIAEINVERYELTKAGQIQFGHPRGSHDDRLIALALAVYATRTPDTGFMGEVVGVKSSYLL